VTLILVSGTRLATFSAHELTIHDAIVRTAGPDGPHVIHVGDNKGTRGTDGVDFIVWTMFHRRPGWTVIEHEARWEECAANCPEGTARNPHRRPRQYGRGTYCPGAGMRRNMAMVDAFLALGGKTMLAFPAANTKSAGTRGCIRYAEKCGLIVPDDHIVPLAVEVRTRARRN
jgi:hypothetical protein